MNASRKDLESALAFVLQSQRRLIDAERLERTVRNVQRGETQLVKHAEDQTQTAANTLDAAAMEFTDLIHDAIKDGIMRAVASMAADSAIPGVSHALESV